MFLFLNKCLKLDNYVVIEQDNFKLEKSKEYIQIFSCIIYLVYCNLVQCKQECAFRGYTIVYAAILLVVKEDYVDGIQLKMVYLGSCKYFYCL